MFTFPIYPITDKSLSGLSHSDQVSALLNTGVEVVQLREKDLNPREFFEDAKKALKIAHSAGIKIIINDRVDIAMALGADGVHLGQDDLSPRAARELLGKDAIIGFSTHTAAQAAIAANYPVDYIAIGPVFETKTKLNPEPRAGVHVLKGIISRNYGIPVVAIGGIDQKNIGLIAAAGAEAAAVIDAVMSDDSGIVAAIKQLNESWLNKNV